MTGRVDISSIVSREPFVTGPLVSGANFERAVLADRRLILGSFVALPAEVASGVRASQLVEWWVTRVREAFDTWVPA
jgi:hypothetical protein